MKFEDIRITAKTGGGSEMTLKHMFQGMAPTIKEIAGEGQSDGVTEQRVNELVGEAVEPLAQQELIDVKQQNAALEARLAALEAGANAN